MKYKIHYTSKVRRDLDEIWDYIVSEYQNISSADKIIQSIMDAVEQLESFPSLGPALDSIIDVKSDYRFLTTGKYLTFYRILEDEIRVERVLYGSRDYRPCLLDDFQIKSSARRKKLRRAGFQVPGHADAQLSVDFRRDGKR